MGLFTDGVLSKSKLVKDWNSNRNINAALLLFKIYVYAPTQKCEENNTTNTIKSLKSHLDKPRRALSYVNEAYCNDYINYIKSILNKIDSQGLWLSFISQQI